MGFRDDELAGRERIEVLERELEALREEAEALRARSAAPAARPPNKLAGFALILFVLALIAIGMAVLTGWTIPSYGDDLGIALALVATLLMTMAATLAVVGRLLIIVPPNKLVVLAGRRTRGQDGRDVGYRVVRAGRVLRSPLIEQAHELDLTPMIVEEWIRGAFVRRGERVDIRFRARIEVETVEPGVRHAIERFLGRHQAEIAQTGSQTIEGALRAVAANVSADDLRIEAVKIAEMMTEEAEEDFRTLGLRLMSLRLLEVLPS